MYIAKVIGNVVSTRKEEALVGKKILIVQPIDENFEPIGSIEVAVDAVGSGSGEIVLIATGSSANNVFKESNSPIDRAIIGIIDTVQIN